MGEIEQRSSIDIDSMINRDLEIDESNLIGELRKQKDILYKWGSKLSKLEDKYKRTCLTLDILIKEKHQFYSTEYERVLSSPEVKIYVAGDAEIIELKNKKRELETMMDTIRHGINAIKVRNRTLLILVEQQRLGMM
jgi:hypothetical protein